MNEEVKVNIDKADLFTIIQFGSKEDFIKKLQLENKSIENIKNLCDNNKVSLLSKCLAFRKFEIAKMLLTTGTAINVVSNQGLNELHYLVSNIHEVGAIAIGNILLEKGVDINLADKKYGNTPLWYLCLEATRSNSEELYAFIEKCLYLKPEIDKLNSSGISIRIMIEKGDFKFLSKLIKKVSEQK